jgi:Fe2+ or Zn2+ uptake regulation protein
LLEILLSFGKPLSAKGILEQIEKKIKNTDQVTVYRTLKTLSEKGIVHSVHWGGDALLYEISREHHHHMVCTSCGDIEDFHECDFDKISKNILRGSKKFSHIMRHSFELFGLCSCCSGKSSVKNS